MDVRKTACEKCPAAHHPADPESRDYLDQGTTSQLLEMLFECAWTPGLLCRGNFDVTVRELDRRIAAGSSRPLTRSEVIRECVRLKGVADKSLNPDDRKALRDFMFRHDVGESGVGVLDDCEPLRESPGATE